MTKLTTHEELLKHHGKKVTYVNQLQNVHDAQLNVLEGREQNIFLSSFNNSYLISTISRKYEDSDFSNYHDITLAEEETCALCGKQDCEHTTSEASHKIQFIPKLGEIVEVSDDGEEWSSNYTFFSKLDDCFICFQYIDSIERLKIFKSFTVIPWKYARPLTQKLKLTKQQIAEKFNTTVEGIEIID